MNTKTKRIVGISIFLASCSPAAVWAIPPIGLGQAWLASAAAGDDGPTDVQQADDLLHQARKAMAEGQYELADSCISRAEKLNPKYGIFHTGDTPKKARADLSRKLGLRPDGSSYSAPAGSAQSPAGPKDPFLARNDGAANPGANEGNTQGADAGANAPHPWETAGAASGGNPSGEQPMRLPPVGDGGGPANVAWNQPAGGGYPSTGLPPVNVGQGNSDWPRGNAAAANPRAQSDALLLNARKALAVGDTRQAASLVDQAKGLQVHYELTEDSPAKVEALVHRYTDLMSQNIGHDTDAYKHQYAALAMEQAQWLLRWRQFDESERLASEVKRMQIQFNPIETRPDALLEQITAERRGGVPAGPASTVPLDLVQLGGGDAHGGGSPAEKPRAVELTRQARAALAQGDVRQAEQLARQADGLAPDSAFGPREDRPALVLLDIQKARFQGGSGVMLAGGAVADGGQVNQSLYDANQDPSRVVQAGGGAEELPSVQQAPNPMPLHDSSAEPLNDRAPMGVQLFQRGERALAQGNRDEALRLFRQAYTMQDQLDGATRQRLQDRMQMLAAGTPRPLAGDGLLAGAAARQQVMIKQMSSDISRAQSAAHSMQPHDPKGALAVLQRARGMVETAPPDLDPQARQQLLRRVDASIEEMQQFIQKNLSQIELDEHNRQVQESVDHDRQAKVVIGEKLAGMVDQYNKCIDERRFAEAEVWAKRAEEMDPSNPLVHQMVLVSKALRRMAVDTKNMDDKEEGINLTLQKVDEAAIPFTKDGLDFGRTGPEWAQLTERRHKLGAGDDRRRTPGDIEIEQKLSTPVSLRFKQAPLNEVLDYLAKVTQVNLHVDPHGLEAEGVRPDTPVTIDLARDIQLRSALALILEPLHLNYVIKDEVLKITSEDTRHGNVYVKSYPVADLVIPIPNFGPDGHMGINAALQEGYNRAGYGGGPGGGASPFAVVASPSGANSNAMLNPAIAAQIRAINTPNSGQTQSGSPQPSGYGPGGAKGGPQADFDSLIELITSTIAPTSWDGAGGAGSIAPFETNLTLVVSQTQEVHEQIADLLNQLRRLQDLQVTIEVRFITLDDDYFERIGVNFNFDIPTNPGTISFGSPTSGGSQVTGLDATGLFQGTSNTNLAGQTIETNAIQFRQGSFAAAQIPTFPGLNPDATPASFGFAILSDIQAYFLIQALEGDDRTNILQAPKVTLFNGQQAFVSDTSQMPFVTSVIPVVGDFAVGQQPIITVLNEGTSLTVQAVVSNDRRFVRLTVVPFFSQIGPVSTFTFTGTSTSTDNSANSTGSNTTSTSTGTTTTNEGTTVQLPTFNFVTVTTTVSVPDGGTVLLGGIKRLSEGRSERGVPILSKIPYLNRLFRNVATGRTTESLMMMVTPRIIIQEEEEAKLLGTTP